MMYVDFEAGNKTYKLRLNTRNIVALESQLGCNPLLVFGINGDKFPTVTQMVNILYCSLIQYNHGITLNDAFEIFDNYLEDGHSATDFIQVIVDIYKVSGLMDNDKENNSEKN